MLARLDSPEAALTALGRVPAAGGRVLSALGEPTEAWRVQDVQTAVAMSATAANEHRVMRESYIG
jgi:hypothetical protein